MQSNDLIRVSVPVHTTWTVGQHFFVQFLSFGPHAWTTHPFTSCSLPPRQGVHETREAEVVFYIRQREGVTGRLGRHLSSRPHSTTKVTLDGPYGGVNMRRFESCSQVVVVAGGSGAGWTIPFILAHLRRVDLALSFSRHIELPGLRVILATLSSRAKSSGIPLELICMTASLSRTRLLTSLDLNWCTPLEFSFVRRFG